MVHNVGESSRAGGILNRAFTTEQEAWLKDTYQDFDPSNTDNLSLWRTLLPEALRDVESSFTPSGMDWPRAHSDLDPSAPSYGGSGVISPKFALLDIFTTVAERSEESPVKLWPPNNFAADLALVVAEIQCRVHLLDESGSSQIQPATLYHRERVVVEYDWDDSRGREAFHLPATSLYDLIHVGRDLAYFLRKEEKLLGTTLPGCSKWRQLEGEATRLIKAELSGDQQEIALLSFFLAP